MAEAKLKVGIIACSGEEIPAGTVSRAAARRVLEMLRPQGTVTLCLPLFLAGEESERRFARQHPTITVDGCEKLCAKRGTEQTSGQVAASLVVTEILGDRLAGCHRSQREVNQADEQASWIVAERIAAEVDRLLESPPTTAEPQASGGTPACVCSCGGPSLEGSLDVGGQAVVVNCLPLILADLYNRGVKPDADGTEHLLATVRIYHAIEPSEESAYRDALSAAYRDYCQRRLKQTQEHPAG
jgi:uncharacterized metal-binding protein